MEPPLQLDGAAAIGRPTTINRSHATHKTEQEYNHNCSKPTPTRRSSVPASGVTAFYYYCVCYYVYWNCYYYWLTSAAASRYYCNFDY